MNVHGLDFTSAPSPIKPITLASCTFEEDLLTIVEIKPLTSFAQFEGFLGTNGEWIAGIDFPFGQPRKLVTNLGWPEFWDDYVQEVSGMKKEEFGDLLRKYRAGRERGDKQHQRRVDELAGSCSPMMWHGVPVGKMFFEGAPRLLQSKACVLPFRRPKPGYGIIVEAYPALVVRNVIGTRKYKSDQRKKWTEDRQAAREEIIKNLSSSKLQERYGFRVKLGDDWAEQLIVDDRTGDRLDAMLCAIQGAWAYRRRHQNFGIPYACDLLEGWIVDPILC